MTVEHLLKEQWQGGKKTVHLMRMAKSVLDSNGEPVDDWRCPSCGRNGIGIHISLMQLPRILLMNKVELTVLFEDEHILAVVKPAGIATHPDGPTDTGTLMNRCHGIYSKQWRRLC